MSNVFQTEQEAFWAGDFGTNYIERNTPSPQNIAGAVARWTQILQRTTKLPASVLELGCNIGINLRAVHSLLPAAKLEAVEINPAAAQIVREWGKAEVHEGSCLEFSSKRQYDLTFTAGVLIHINPEHLPSVYDLLYRASSRYICVAEYYSPTPMEVSYRGHEGRLFKRDFAGELLDRYADLCLQGYGFFYHRDPLVQADDSTWFLLEKQV